MILVPLTVIVLLIIICLNLYSIQFQNISYAVTPPHLIGAFHLNTTTTSLILNSKFDSMDNATGLPSNWNDKLDSCRNSFSCKISVTDGWDDESSFRLSTKDNSSDKWSWIYGQQIDVKPNEVYQIVTHMKLNSEATQSHIKLEGFDENMRKWYQIKQCPSGNSGPFEWREISCIITIPETTSKIRPVLNAGWSSQGGKEAITWFDSVYFIKLKEPFIIDPNLKLEVLYKGLDLPTSIAFLGPNDILVTENINGTVQRIVDGVKLTEPLIDLDVARHDGLLGIAVQKDTDKPQPDSGNDLTHVFLYFTAAKKDGGDPLGNVLYRYDLVNNKLENPKLLLDLPVARQHFGGKLLIGQDELVYLTVGEVQDDKNQAHKKSSALNNIDKDADEPNGRGGILRIDQNGNPILDEGHGILGDKAPLDKYYAYGIRNIFGIDFDPVTEKLWDTENGPTFGDEINLVEPGFNSGWRKVQGIWNIADGKNNGEEKKEGLASEEPDNLVDFDSRGKYSPPEFTWDHPVGPTALKFLTTDKLGKEYENDMLIADSNNGRIYHFELNGDRTALSLKGPLKDKLAGTVNELDDVIFSAVSGSITDLEIGSDGNLYIIAYGSGILYRVSPSR